MHIKIPFAIALTMASASAFSNLEQLSYTDTQSLDVASPPTKTHINPVGEMQWYISAGVGQSIRVVGRPSGQSTKVFAIDSPVISTSDTITVNGETFPGTTLSIPAIDEDGVYDWSVEYLSSGKVISSEAYTQTLDRIAPNVTQIRGFSLGLQKSGLGGILTEDGQLASAEAQALNGILDSDSAEIAEAIFESYYASGPNAGDLYKSAPATAGYHESTGTHIVSIGQMGNNNALSSFYPYLNGRVKSVFKITDLAGNKSTHELEHYLHFVCDSGDSQAEVVGVYDPGYPLNPVPGMDYTGYRPYTPGMEVNQNPLRVLYRIPASKTVTEDPVFGYYITSSLKQEVDANNDYRYYITETSYSGSSSRLQGFPEVRLSSQSYYSCENSSVRTALASGASMEQSPGNPTKVTYQINGQPYSSSLIRFNETDGDILIERTDFTVPERTYDQKITSALGACIVPAGDQTCHTEPNKSLGAPNSIAHIHSRVYVRSIDEKLEAFDYMINIRTDRQPPVVDSLTYHKTSSTYELRGTELNTGAFWGDIKMHTGRMVFTDINTGNVITLNPKTHDTNSSQHTYTFDASAIPSGHYNVASRLTDYYGNITETLADDLIKDNDAPVISIDELTTNGQEVSRIDAINVVVLDEIDPDAQLISAQLTGGPNNINYQLPRQEQEDGSYRMGLPVIIPSDTSLYTLKFTARDSSGNTSSLNRTFLYNPPRVATEWGSEFNIFSNIEAIYSPTSPHSSLRSEPLLDGYDLPIAGVYEVTASLVQTSSTPVEINGFTLQPGDSVVVDSAYDLGANDSRVELPLRLVDQNKRADLILSTTSPSAPIVVFTATSNVPTLSLPVTNAAPRQLDTVGFTVAPINGICDPIYASPENLSQYNGTNPVTDPICFYEWSQPIEFAHIDSITGEMLGQVETEGQQTVTASVFAMLNGTKHPLMELEQTINVASLHVTTTVSSKTLSVANSRIEPYTFSLAQTNDCTFTDKAENVTKSTRPLCVLQFTNLPEGFEEPYLRRLESRRGTFQEAGEYTFEWRLGGVGRSGEIIWSDISQHTVTVVDPAPPRFDILKGVWLDTGEAAVSHTSPESLVTVRNAEEAYVDIKIESDRLPEPIIHTRIRPGQYVSVPGFEGEMWSLGEYTITSSYTDHSLITAEDHFTARVMPSSRLATSLTGARSHINTTDYDLNYNMGISDRGELLYDPAQLGEWEVFIAYSSNGELHPITETKTMVSGGISFTISAEQLQELTRSEQRFYAHATLLAPQPLLKREITSRIMAPRIFNGVPVEADISATITEGPAPLNTRLRLSGSQQDMMSIGELQWQTSSDGGATWADVQNGQRSSISLQLPAGDHLVRTKLTNRYSGLESVTESFPIWAYNQIEVKVSGTEYTEPGAVATFTAQSFVGGQPAPPTEYEWSYRNSEGQLVTQVGNTLQYSQEKDGMQYFNVKARLAESDPTLRHNYTNARWRLFIASPTAPRVSLRGPSLVEAGYNYEFTAITLSAWREKESTMEVEEQWILPDGSLVSGAVLNFTPSDQLLEEVGFGSYFDITHQAWIKNHKEDTMRESVRRIRIWKYEWPDFEFKTKLRYVAAPTTINIDVKPTDLLWYRRTFGEQISYEWTIPAGIEVIRERNEQVTLNAPSPGSYSISARVSDTRGNQSTVSADIVVEPTPPYDLRMDLRPSNRYSRAPFTLNARLATKGGHRENRVTGIIWYINDVQANPEIENRPAFDLTAPGQYRVKALLETELGVTSELTETYIANENTPPTCEIHSFKSGLNLVVDARCSDIDGSVSDYRWVVDGEPVALTSRRISFNVENKTSVEVELTALDDGGAPVIVRRTIPL
jgi:hypothetical protein